MGFKTLDPRLFRRAVWADDHRWHMHDCPYINPVWLRTKGAVLCDRDAFMLPCWYSRFHEVIVHDLIAVDREGKSVPSK